MTMPMVVLVAGVAVSAVTPLRAPDETPPTTGLDTIPIFTETFDDYTPGQGLQPQGAQNGWEPFWGTGADGLVVDSPKGYSPPNAFRYLGSVLTDQANKIDFTNQTKYIISVQTYVPSATAGQGYFIVHNHFDNLCAEWALQVEFDSVADTVRNDAGGFRFAPSLPLIRDEWVRYTAIVDLAADRYWDYYGSELLTNEYKGMPLGWRVNNAVATGACSPSGRSIANLNLFSNGAEGQLIDDVIVACYADMTAATTGGGAGMLDVFDFLAYQDAFVSGDVIADCNGDRTLDIFDFLCFQDAFTEGCGM